MSDERLGPGPVRYHALRLVLKAVVGAYVRMTVVGADKLPPTGPYIICFNHPSWLDPFFLAANWPDRVRRFFIFGPREQDMSDGIRNRLIHWTKRDVPFKPGGDDALDATRRAVAVLESGACLAIAGEGRLSDHEGEILPLQTGVAHFARLAHAPIVPTAIIGSRWVQFGSRVTLRIGDLVDPADYGPGKTGVREMTAAVEERFRVLLDGVEDGDPPGWLGRTISEAFNERPWLDEAESASTDEKR